MWAIISPIVCLAVFVATATSFSIERRQSAASKSLLDMGFALSELPSPSAQEVQLSRQRRQTTNDVIEFTMNTTMNSHIEWNTVEMTQNDQSYVSRTNFPGGDIQKCPLSVANGQEDPIHFRSTCPWYYVTDHDPSRFPTTILKAKTPCMYCVGNPSLECVPLKKSITVLQKSPTAELDGSFKFFEKEQEVTMGFTCASPRNAINAADTTTASPANDIWA
ncbi:uncharacterized protein LOC128232360 [Mya arenaria]|uniref:uncharacterized protein LOC128232360 n=1 Tax=Mya arenaria TaxID=6604 RepID=UPI0022E76171|nr:uncharacterized protein LOC128232360 [Mya arenaria]